MAEELTYKDEAAAGYDLAFGHVTAMFAPTLLKAARLGPGMRVLDVATGTGIVAQESLKIVGQTGYVTATDVSPAMIARARAPSWIGKRDGCCGGWPSAIISGSDL